MQHRYHGVPRRTRKDDTHFVWRNPRNLVRFHSRTNALAPPIVAGIGNGLRRRGLVGALRDGVGRDMVIIGLDEVEVDVGFHTGQCIRPLLSAQRRLDQSNECTLSSTPMATLGRIYGWQPLCKEPCLRLFRLWKVLCKKTPHPYVIIKDATERILLTSTPTKWGDFQQVQREQWEMQHPCEPFRIILPTYYTAFKLSAPVRVTCTRHISMTNAALWSACCRWPMLQTIHPSQYRSINAKGKRDNEVLAHRCPKFLQEFHQIVPVVRTHPARVIELSARIKQENHISY